ncbi:Guanine deaminase [Sodalis glossinidius str. 'morsitans']|uniref:Guanine deaminase n=1 Tax=Sodalis glossinidius (strain morsitans) TaxID=343509 RepID=A0A193QK21_SODGM|nr:guanine deaminase [Sodalis glossinidius]CRL45527.1 Guanine deaminase [Sodalis glossinidius str. 'morsitans']
MHSIKAIRGSFFDITHTVQHPDALEQAARFIEDGLIIIDGGKIRSLQTWEEGRNQLPPSIPLSNFPDKIIVPGFIDCHVHYPQTEMIGAWGSQLLEWLNQYTFPTESQYHCADHAAAMSDFFLDQLLRNGTTSALVFGTVHAASVETLFAAAFQRNMRLIAGKVMMDQHAPPALLETPAQSEHVTRRLIERWHNKGRLGYALTPRFAPTSSPQLLSVVGELKREYPDVWLQTHLSENPQEISWVQELYPEREGYLDVYHHYGLTGHKSVFAHCLHLEDKEWQCLAATRSAIAFCPTSNLFLGSGLFNLQKSWNAGVAVGIGSDVGAGTTFNALETLSEAYKVAQLQHYRLSVYEAFYHATLGAAQALALEGVIGNFAAGKEADMVILDPAATPLQRLRQQNGKDIHERLFALMILGDDRNIYPG